MCKKQNISHRNGQVLNSVGNLNHLKFRCQSGMEENHWYNKLAEWITSLQCLYLAHSGWYVPNWTIRVHQRIWLQKGQDQTVWIVALGPHNTCATFLNSGSALGICSPHWVILAYRTCLRLLQRPQNTSQPGSFPRAIHADRKEKWTN